MHAALWQQQPRAAPATQAPQRKHGKQHTLQLHPAAAVATKRHPAAAPATKFQNANMQLFLYLK